jgi:hypothetical protein
VPHPHISFNVLEASPDHFAPSHQPVSLCLSTHYNNLSSKRTGTLPALFSAGSEVPSIGPAHSRPNVFGERINEGADTQSTVVSGLWKLTPGRPGPSRPTAQQQPTLSTSLLAK